MRSNSLFIDYTDSFEIDIPAHLTRTNKSDIKRKRLPVFTLKTTDKDGRELDVTDYGYVG